MLILLALAGFSFDGYGHPASSLQLKNVIEALQKNNQPEKILELKLQRARLYVDELHFKEALKDYTFLHQRLPLRNDIWLEYLSTHVKAKHLFVSIEHDLINLSEIPEYEFRSKDTLITLFELRRNISQAMKINETLISKYNLPYLFFRQMRYFKTLHKPAEEIATCERAIVVNQRALFEPTLIELLISNKKWKDMVSHFRKTEKSTLEDYKKSYYLGLAYQNLGEKNLSNDAYQQSLYLLNHEASSTKENPSRRDIQKKIEVAMNHIQSRIPRR